ncbi:MAG TPA: DUF4349 domain-containing protein [Clostridia bacterium]|nr:DUF4349 domain-containing protein [Clostridia bacterium]
MLAWIKKNWLVLLLGLAVVYLLFRSQLSPLTYLPKTTSFESSLDLGAPSLGGIGQQIIPPRTEYPPSEKSERLVVEESNLSLVVKSVRQSVDKIIAQAQSAGGYMVSSSLSQPEEAPYATVIVRVPAEKLNEVLENFRSLAVKVSSENLVGKDVTDEYEDLDARLRTLYKTKTKFEEILAKATRVEEILQVQRELISLQTQIDSLKGRQEYLQKTAQLAKVTVYLSTDEFALPYTPSKPFRPTVIFKQAVRSLVGTARGLVKAGIWLVVYSIIWLPILLIVWFIRRRKLSKT